MGRVGYTAWGRECVCGVRNVHVLVPRAAPALFLIGITILAGRREDF